MAPKEATANALLLLVAGHDSAVNTISNCVMTLLRNPGSIELLRAEPELIPRAIEEVQRLQSAVQFFPQLQRHGGYRDRRNRHPERMCGASDVQRRKP